MGGIIGSLIGLAIFAFYMYCGWKLFTKANEPGWAYLVPIYNLVVLLKICGKPLWWIVLFLIPVVNAVAGILVLVSLCKSFGKSAGYAIAMLFVGFILFPMLALGDAKYQGPAG